jgi:Ca2+-transporting ATPase
VRAPRDLIGTHSLRRPFLFLRSVGRFKTSHFPRFCSVLLDFMASDDLDIPQIAVVGVPDDISPSSSSPAVPSPSVDSSRLPPSPSTTDSHAYLSPTPILRSARNSLDPLGSPTHASDNSSLVPPPSPTLSAHSSGSVRWANSTILRDNNPEEHDGSSSLYLAPPSHGHRRKGSTGTVSSIGSGSTTEQDADDNSSLRLSPLRSTHSDVTSTLPSPTYTHVDSVSDGGSRHSSVTSLFKKTVDRVRRPSPSPSRETDTGSDTTRNDNADGKRKGAELARPVVLDLKQEADLDVHPFGFKPLQLASLVDPKNLETLESMGGVRALLHGLGTHPNHGLSTESGSPIAHIASPDPTLQSFTVSHATDKDPPKPDIMITSPAGEPQGLPSTASLGGDVPAEFQSSEEVYRTSIEDRQRIFGQNVLPRRPSKTLLQLMWLALKDKVLVSYLTFIPILKPDGRLPQVLLSVCAVVSLALGLFQDFGTTRPDGDPPVDWVEGVTIIVAVLIVVGVGSLNDWQKEKQFESLNEKREERSVKVIRNGREHLIDVHDVVVGDVVLLEPGEVIPCDGVFLSGHNVRCDESSATGESDAIKKLPYQECITLRNKRLAEFDPDSLIGDAESTSALPRKNPSGLELLGHTDCFVVSGSKVVEGVGSYLVISVGQKSFNGRIMMGSSLSPPCNLAL